MAKKNIYTEESLRLLGLVKGKDGTYSRPKIVQQPREVNKLFPHPTDKSKSIDVTHMFEKDHIDAIKPNEEFRRISLVLLGEPMPKQSVLGGKHGFYQPKKKTDRKNDYIRQIKNQLPKDFVPFMTEVHVTKFHCIYAPLKSFQKKKGMMEKIRNGEIVYKNTQPDLIDNLKKLVFDCMGKDSKTKMPLVLGNDGIIVTENNTAKYYGMGGCILIDLTGK